MIKQLSSYFTQLMFNELALSQRGTVNIQPRRNRRVSKFHLTSMVVLIMGLFCVVSIGASSCSKGDKERMTAVFFRNFKLRISVKVQTHLEIWDQTAKESINYLNLCNGDTTFDPKQSIPKHIKYCRAISCGHNVILIHWTGTPDGMYIAYDWCTYSDETDPKPLGIRYLSKEKMDDEWSQKWKLVQEFNFEDILLKRIGRQGQPKRNRITWEYFHKTDGILWNYLQNYDFGLFGVDPMRVFRCNKSRKKLHNCAMFVNFIGKEFGLEKLSWGEVVVDFVKGEMRGGVKSMLGNFKEKCSNLCSCCSGDVAELD